MDPLISEIIEHYFHNTRRCYKSVKLFLFLIIDVLSSYVNTKWVIKCYI